MKKLASFGTGKHAVRFIWKDVFLQKVYVEYRANSRANTASILRKFLRSLKRVNIESKSISIKDIINENVTYGYKWLAAHCPECQIATYSKDNKHTQKKTYLFDYHFTSYVTLQGIQRLLNSSTDNRN